MDNKIIYILLTILAGTAVTFQGPINGALGKVVKPEYATLWSFITGTVVISGIIMIKRLPLPELKNLVELPWWYFVGGFIGILYVFLIIVIIPKLGAAPTIFLVILSQILMAIVIDYFGLVGLQSKAISINRIIGVCFMIFGVFLVNK